MSKFFHPLMENNITKEDRQYLSNFILKNNKFTQGKMVSEFEKKWSKWLGVKYSVFVNSGSSANYLTFSCLKILGHRGNVLTPTLTWNSDINSVLGNNFNPVFLDIDIKNLAMSEEQIIKQLTKKNNKIVFLSHIQGFNGLSKKILSIIKKKGIILIEDVCESHGARFENKKLGTFGLISNFSFYYAHHLTTIEGGMICTNNREIYEICKMMRGHGLLREIKNPKFEKSIKKKFKDLSPQFIFLHQGFNMRNNEIGAALGIRQLKRLNKNVRLRKNNLQHFLLNLDGKKYFTDFIIDGNSNYAFPIILKTKSIRKRNEFEKFLTRFKIEFRRGNAGGGNQLRQPYLDKIRKKINLNNYKNVDHIHNFGYYIGNFPSLKKNKIKEICKILNSFQI